MALKQTRWVVAVVVAMALSVPAVPALAQTSCLPPTGPADPAAVTGGSGALSARQPGPAPDVAPVQCWVGATGNAALGARVVALGDLVVTFSDQNEVVAFPSDGSEAWRLPLGEPGEGLPGGLATDGRLVFAAAPVGLVGLDATDGSEAWRITAEPSRTDTTGAHSPVSVGDRVYFVLDTAGQEESVDRWVVAIDASSGEEHWRVSLYPTLPAGPVSADRSTVVLWDGLGTIIALEAGTGEERWSVPVETLGLPPAAPISLGDEMLVTGLVGSEVVALSTQDGAKLWEFAPDSGMTAAVTLQDDAVYVNGATHLYALDAADGQQRWTARLQEKLSPFEYRPVPAVMEDVVILGTTDVAANAALLAFDVSDGAERWRTPVPIFGALLSPIVTGGRVYAAGFDINQEGGLFAFGTPS